MNILIISKYASPPRYSKVSSRLFSLSKEFLKKGHSVTLISSDSTHLAKYPYTSNTYNFEKYDNLNFIWIKTLKYKKTASIKRVLSWIHFEIRLFLLRKKIIKKPDVIIVSSLSIFTILYGLYLKNIFKSFLVFEVRDIWPLTLIAEGGFSKFHPLVLFIGYLEKIGYKYSDLIVGTMPKLDKHVESILGYSKPFHFSPLGFDYKVSQLPENDEIEILSKFPKGKKIIGYAGSIGLSNSLDTFFNAIKLMQNEHMVHFMVVGDGDLKCKFESDLKDATNVTFLNRINHDKIKYFLKYCDVLYLSTKDSIVWNYGQSMNKVLEYMLAGKPIIANYSGFPSMINDADCGTIISDNNTEKLISSILYYVEMSNEERNKIGLNGRNWVLKYRDYENLSEDYLNKIKLFK